MWSLEYAVSSIAASLAMNHPAMMGAMTSEKLQAARGFI
jgi:hypothetical protein